MTGCENLDNVIVKDFVIPIVCSIIGAIIFWLLTFKLSYTKVIFSHKLEHFYHEGKWRTRYQIACPRPQNMRKPWVGEKTVGRHQKRQTYVVCRPAWD